jgi:transposase
MKRPGVTLAILWEEYDAVHPQGYGYSRFCELYREFERRLSPTMRQTHVAGHKAFVDYSGKKVPITDPLTGEVRMAEIFVGVLGASNLTYAEATWTQALPDWIGAHVRMFRFWGSAPRLLVPDNLKSGVNKASFYDPEINRTYGKMATHYHVGILPTRPRKPKDKAAVEAGVRFAQYYILGRLRNVTFFFLAECNAAIAAALERMNGREMRRLGASRRQLFDTIERQAMQSLPEDDYEYAEWHLARVGIDYHVEVAGFFIGLGKLLLGLALLGIGSPNPVLVVLSGSAALVPGVVDLAPEFSPILRVAVRLRRRGFEHLIIAHNRPPFSECLRIYARVSAACPEPGSASTSVASRVSGRCATRARCRCPTAVSSVLLRLQGHMLGLLSGISPWSRPKVWEPNFLACCAVERQRLNDAALPSDSYRQHETRPIPNKTNTS